MIKTLDQAIERLYDFIGQASPFDEVADAADLLLKELRRRAAPASKPSRGELLIRLRELAMDSDYESTHPKADDLLVAYIDDAEIAAAYNAVGKWYA